VRSLVRPLPRAVTRPITILLLVAWAGVMAVLVNRSYLQASSANLATDLARYTSAAAWHWRLYYRGEKIGFTVSQILPTIEGFELEEDGRLQMSLLGATNARDHSQRPLVSTNTFRFDRSNSRSTPELVRFEVRGLLDGTHLTLAVKTASGTRTEVREMAEPPALSLNLSRRLRERRPRTRGAASLDDLRSRHPSQCAGGRGLSASASSCGGPGAAPIPAFRVETEFAGLRTTFVG